MSGSALLCKEIEFAHPTRSSLPRVKLAAGLRSVGSDDRGDRGRSVCSAVVRIECALDCTSDLVDRSGQEFDPLDRLVGVPACEVGDALAAGVEPDAAADDAGDALDDQFRLGTGATHVVDPVGVGQFVDDGGDLAVRR